MDMTIEQMKAAVAAAEAAEMAAMMPAGFTSRGDDSFFCGRWTLVRQPAASHDPARRWRAFRFRDLGSAQNLGSGYGATPAEAIRACKADLRSIAEWAAASALELPEVTP